LSRWVTPGEALEAIRTGTGKGIKVAVLDSGVESSHAVFEGMSFTDDLAVIEEERVLKVVAGEGRDRVGHGTAIDGIIHKVAPEAEIGSIRVLGDALAARTAFILEGAREAIGRGYQILNCSFGCRLSEHVLKYKSWVDEAYVKGVHVVSACNNQDESRPEWPAFFTSVIAVNVGAADRDGELYYDPRQLVEFSTRGINVEVAWSGGTMKTVTGSSFAAPRVSGMLACLLSRYPDLSPVQTKALLQQIARRAETNRSNTNA
jgi:subtilisin